MSFDQTLCAENAGLTANYYKEYLGFRELRRSKSSGRQTIWLSLNNQILVLEEGRKTHLTKGPAIFYLDKLEDYYLRVKPVVRIKKPLAASEENNRSFTYLDCNGNCITISDAINYSNNNRGETKEHNSSALVKLFFPFPAVF
ncbi:MAG: VOC family protein [Bacteroidales bacterium]